jgi:hypothetical protein
VAPDSSFENDGLRVEMTPQNIFGLRCHTYDPSNANKHNPMNGKELGHVRWYVLVI